MAADAPHPLDHAIRFFDKADGRDKLYKTLQNWSKVMAWRYTVLALTAPTPERKAARESAAMYRKVAESLSSFRSLQKFFKWIKTAKEVHVALAAPADMSAGAARATCTSFAVLIHLKNFCRLRNEDRLSATLRYIAADSLAALRSGVGAVRASTV
eukprot:Rhum_TRINITY_DN8591_c1_g1::Rhum_TRINITY_DN8591_c1_g1_i2::g.28892::m.28892